MFPYIGNKVLLQKRTDDAPSHPSHWGGFGGHAKDGETPTTTAIRELREELGLALDASDLQPICVIPVTLGHISATVHYFSTRLAVPLSELALNEGSGFALFGRDEIGDLLIVPHTKLALDQFFDS